MHLRRGIITAANKGAGVVRGRWTSLGKPCPWKPVPPRTGAGICLRNSHTSSTPLPWRPGVTGKHKTLNPKPVCRARRTCGDGGVLQLLRHSFLERVEDTHKSLRQGVSVGVMSGALTGGSCLQRCGGIGRFDVLDCFLHFGFHDDAFESGTTLVLARGQKQRDAESGERSCTSSRRGGERRRGEAALVGCKRNCRASIRQKCRRVPVMNT